ncbi:hypothetical protein [Amycolatopsis circi]|uniref:hypothetical protein n=1 Tax=Amycolatopsis circi TaxID=871959 RepID=UPI000E22CDDC|nr:hypothetical protein [Amycolatopsis circi]
MIKQLGFVATALAAGMAIVGGSASAAGAAGAGGPDGHGHGGGQVGLGNVHNLDAVHNLNLVGGVCDNNVNVLGVQVPVRDVAQGLNVPVLSPGENGAAGKTPYNCASGTIVDGGSDQGH